MTPTETQRKIDRRLARVEGQIRGIRKMVRERAYCIEVLTQIAAARAAMNQVAAAVVSGHVQGCILDVPEGHKHAQSTKMSHEDLLVELEITLSRLMR